MAGKEQEDCSGLEALLFNPWPAALGAGGWGASEALDSAQDGRRQPPCGLSSSPEPSPGLALDATPRLMKTPTIDNDSPRARLGDKHPANAISFNRCKPFEVGRQRGFADEEAERVERG